MPKEQYPVTAAIRFLREKRIAFVPHLYPYEEHGGTHHAAAMLNVSEHAVIKTLVMETDTHAPLLVLMHGDREVSTRQLARSIGARHVEPCPIATAQKYTGYLVGGISPFGTRTKLPIYVEATIFMLARIYINGGKRGFLIELAPQDLRTALAVQEVNVALEPS
jgi:Cys-tRNA(Pro) deacylase